MALSRRKFLSRAASLLVNPPSGVIGGVWQQVSGSSVAASVTYASPAHASLAMMLQFAPNFLPSFLKAKSLSSLPDKGSFVPILNEAVQSLGFFELRKDSPFRSWQDIYHSPADIEEIVKNSHGYFTNADSVRKVISAIAESPVLQGVPLPEIYHVARNKLVQELMLPHASVLKDFDWVGFMRGKDCNDDIEVVYQMLHHFSDHLPEDVVASLEDAYNVMSFNEKLTEIKDMPIRQAALFLKMFEDQSSHHSWTISRQKWSWNNWSARYSVIADMAGDEGVLCLSVLQKEWQDKYGERVVFQEISCNPETGQGQFFVDVDERCEDDFDMFCSLSYVRSHREILDSIKIIAVKDVPETAISPLVSDRSIDL